MVAKLALVADYDGPADKAPPLDQESGSAWGWDDRLFQYFSGGKVFDYSDWHARDMEQMLREDYKAKQLERVLCGPMEAAEITLDGVSGDKGELEFCQAVLTGDEFDGGMETPLDLVISQMTSAVVYRKAFFELVWRQVADGKIGLRKVAYRPATTCRMIRTPKGQFAGFEQENYTLAAFSGDQWAIKIPPKRAFVYVHGQRRDPMNGISDLDVAFWCYKTKQKILFLWMQFAEQVALPRVTVTASELDVARQVAQQIARVKSSGVVPIAAPGGPQSVGITPLDLSGKGGDQYKAIIDWLDQAAANSVLAGFTNLTNNESGGKWGGALSNDASNFFLQTRESATKEMARDTRRGLLVPLCRYNFGPGARIPRVKVEPLNTEDKSASVDMLKGLLTSRDPALVPDEFIGELAQQVADYLGMDGSKIRVAFNKAAARARAAAAAAGVPPGGQAVAGVAGATNAAVRVVRTAGARPTGVSHVPGINAPQLPAAY